MHPLTEILAPSLPPTDLIAARPNWTRAAFNRAVFHLSRRLKTHRVQSAALWFDDAALFACTVLAAWHAGARVLLLPNTTQENLAWGGTADVFLSDAPHENLFSDGIDAPPALWHLPEILAQMPSESGFTGLSEAKTKRQPENDEQPENWRIAATAQAHLKTSGSSGAAQIIVKTAAQMQAETLALAAALPFDSRGATAVGSVSPQHLYGFTFRFALALTQGWTIERAQAVYPENLLAATAAHGKTVWIASPAVLNRLENGRDWSAAAAHIAGIVSSGGALPEATAARLAAHAVRPYEIYGSTETGIIAARQGGSVWQPFDGMVFGQDAEGALWVQSPWAERVQTADVVEAVREPQAHGFLLLGRKDRIIKFEDKRVSLTQIEHHLLQHAWIADSHCALHPQHKRIAAWAALNEAGIAALREHGRAALADTLKRHLAQSLDKTALPRYWRFADSLPRNAQAKIAAADFQAAFTVPQTAPQWTHAADTADTADAATPDTAACQAAYTARVPLDLVYFGGHFAAFPLVPGVVELQWARDLAARYPWGSQTLVRVENLKYQQFVRPHDEIVLSLDYDAAKNKLAFQITAHGKPCASGRLVFEAA
ncbi:long-chain-fatty-acid--CoA ligase [Kingella potus]|uniref:Long-chain-fatty-acid--CoA ligase n=1 Tax=Kingella potus TaxID=265175 RepID=A0A377R4M5_9NEIS|nr:AMP-binding protein [Kingella potus]UOP01929.1 AMP-binding protein [Kingella potus]STR02932.1 long-chain-fatty-acid--CoA ligase [Kingella potus]